MLLLEYYIPLGCIFYIDC